MKITSFHPIIISPKADELTELFEQLGFTRKHEKDNINDADITSCRMKDENDFYLDIVKGSKRDSDLTAIQINVDNFDEAFELFKTHGFINAQGDRITDTGSSKSTMMFSPSGLAVTISQHIRKEERETAESGNEALEYGVDQDLCIGCGTCADACPCGAISVEDSKASINKDLCISCYACRDACPIGAIGEHRTTIK